MLTDQVLFTANNPTEGQTGVPLGTLKNSHELPEGFFMSVVKYKHLIWSIKETQRILK